MKKKKLWKAMSVALSAAMLATSVPTGVFAAAPEVQTSQEKAADENELKLWYDEKAPNSYDGWEKWSLPLGNSGIGASVFGGITQERIQLNEKSLWSGGPSSSRNYNGGNIETTDVDVDVEGTQTKMKMKMSEVVEKIQQAFAAGDTKTADSLCAKLVGVSDDAGTNGYGYYLSYGNMYLDFKGITESSVSNYKRALDLHTAVASVEYDYNGTHYVRENFVSYPDNVLVTRLTAAGGNGKLNFDVKVDPDNEKGGGSNNPGANSYKRDWNTKVNGGEITVAGTLKDNQMKFNSQTKVIADGTTTDGTDKVTVEDATSVTIITSIATDYKDKYPKYRTGESAEALDTRVGGYVSRAAAKKYDKLKADHIKDYQNIFERVDLDLGQIPSDKTTDALLAAYKSGSATEAERRYLEVMLFQYGRYLTIESSRETPKDDQYRETLPSNLQGIWVGANNSAWHADYHMNVNLQMNYWPTYVTNMAECAEPLINYIDALRAPGRVTAKIYAGVESKDGEENGFMAHTQNNPFGWTCPGWDFNWGWSPAAVPWILQNCWEYYDFTRDANYLKEKIYPMMKEEATLYDQILIEDKDGKLVSSPSYSPEHGPKTSGNTYEQTLVWQLYQDTIEAANIVGESDTAKVTEWKEKQSKLKGPIEVGKSGQIKEWYTETTFNQDANGNSLGQGAGHRHISHMLGLFPGDLISVDTPEWLAAARVSMEKRVDKTTGWGMGQRINTWARLGDGNHAYKLITDLFDGGILTNLWDTHAPYQIDGNFGMTSGVAEMLLQSNMGYINLLPALPDTWSDGSVEGLVARGNFELSYDWSDGSLNQAQIVSNKGGECQVQYSGIAKATITDAEGNVVEATKVDGKTNRISFNTEAGKTYIIKVPEAPKNVKANYYGTSGTKVNWSAVEDATSYNVYRSENGTTFEKIAENTKRTSFVDKKAFTDVSAVSYKVTACYEDKESGDSKVASVKDLTQSSEKLAHDGWKATAGSEENAGNDGPASWAIDGNTTTIWHSKWSSGGTHPDIANDQNNEFTIDFGQTVTVNKFEYVPRSSGISVNGIITKYKLLYSTTESGDDFKELTSGEWDADKTVKTATFAPTEMRRIQIRALATLDDTATKNQHVTAAEFNAYKYVANTPVMIDTDALWNAVLAAQDKDLSIYTDATAKAYQDALDAAKAKLALELEDDMTQEQVDNALAALTAAEGNLEKKQEVQYAKLTGLTGVADSQELTGEPNGNGPAAKALDGKADTYWHTNWKDGSAPKAKTDGTKLTGNNNYIITLAKPSTVTSVTYVPRNGYDSSSGKVNNGAIEQCNVYVTTDGTKWTLTGTIGESNAWSYVNQGVAGADQNFVEKTVTFDKAYADVTKVKIEAIKTAGPQPNEFINAAEFGVIGKGDGTPGEVTCSCALGEITGVQDQTVALDVADSKSVKLKPTATATTCRVDGHDGKVVYTYAVKSAGNTGATVTTDGTVTVKDAGTAVITVTATLSPKGKEALVKTKDVTLTVTSNKASAAEKKELQDEVDSVAGQIADKDNYTAESYQKLQDAVAEANRLLNSGTASKQQIADAKAAIAAAKSGLITKTAAAKKKLGDLLDEVAKLDKKLYTAESYNAMVAADEAAVKAYNKADATEEELTKAYNALKAAQDKLVFKLDQAKKEAAKALEAAKAIYDAGQKDYDDASWKAFGDAYNALKNADEKADAAALTTLIGALSKAQGALTVKKAETPKPEVKLAAPAVKTVKAKAAKGGVTVTVTVEPVKDAAAYDVYRVVKGKAVKVGTTAAGKTVVTDTTAIRGASYYAVAVSADGKTVSEAGAAVAVKLAKAPKIKKASAGTKSVKLTWKKAKGTKVVVYRSTKKNSGYKKAATSRKGAASLVNKKVKAGKTYYYKIATVKGKTVSAMSKAKKVKIKK